MSRKHPWSTRFCLLTLLVLGTASATQAQVPSALVGSWRANQPGPAGVITTTITFQPNGRYTATAVSGGGAFRITNWGQSRLHQNYLRFSVSDYTPKSFQGNSVSYPKSWGMSIKAIGQRTFTTVDGGVFYRIQ